MYKFNNQGAILNACSHSGLVEQALQFLNIMEHQYQIKPTEIHYNSIIDTLTRAGKLEDAELMLDKMPVPPSAITWTALLGAC